MKTLGIVSDINHRGELLVKGVGALGPGTAVFDVRKKKIGIVIRTFGPVGSPYLLVKAGNVPDEEKMRLMSTELYYESDGPDRLKKGVSNSARPRRGRPGAGKHGKKKRKNR